jgi:hypothetical protein
MGNRARCWWLLAALGLASPAPAPAQGTLAGTWEYRQANPARPDGVDAEGERLVVTRTGDGRFTAHYFGLEREGEHGLFYTAVDVGAVEIGADGTIRFVVPARTLYRTRPATLAAAGGLESAGSTKDALTFAGRLTDDTLTFTCTATRGACPDARLVFRAVR